MAVNLEVERNNNETSLSILRRFTKRVQGSGVLPRVRGIRYHERIKSENVRKMKKLKALKKKAFIQEQVKLGKIAEQVPGMRRRRK